MDSARALSLRWWSAPSQRPWRPANPSPATAAAANRRPFSCKRSCLRGCGIHSCAGGCSVDASRRVAVVRHPVGMKKAGRFRNALENGSEGLDSLAETVLPTARTRPSHPHTLSLLSQKFLRCFESHYSGSARRGQSLQWGIDSGMRTARLDETCHF